MKYFKDFLMTILNWVILLPIFCFFHILSFFANLFYKHIIAKTPWSRVKYLD